MPISNEPDRQSDDQGYKNKLPMQISGEIGGNGVPYEMTGVLDSPGQWASKNLSTCGEYWVRLSHTSDAADELPSVNLRGPRTPNNNTHTPFISLFPFFLLT